VGSLYGRMQDGNISINAQEIALLLDLGGYMKDIMVESLCLPLSSSSIQDMRWIGPPSGLKIRANREVI
jgi:hypothetical protein